MADRSMQCSVGGEQMRSGVVLPEESVRPSRLLRLPDVIFRVGLKRSTIYRRMEAGTFPRSRSISAKCAVWVEAEIDEWIHAVARST